MRRFVFTPRWVCGHVTVLVAVVSCLLLGNWQWDVHTITHSLQNMAYAFQWPFFAVFFLVAWWRMLKLESRRLDEVEEQAGEDAVEPAPGGVGAPDGPSAERPSAAEAALRPSPERALEQPGGPRSVPGERTGWWRRAGKQTNRPVDRPVLHSVSAEPLARPEDAVGPADEDPDLAAYNRMLAELAARDQAG